MKEKDIKSNVHEDHRKRMKQRFKNGGIANLQPHEILEMILYYSIPYKDTNPIAHALLNQYGTINQVLKTDAEYLKKVDGVGENTAQYLAFLKQFIAYYIAEEQNPEKLSLKRHSAVLDFVEKQLRILDTEQFLVICVDAKLNKIRHDVLSKGTVNQASINIRAVASYALKFNASGIIIAHNHPSGSPDPTLEDNLLTETMYKALNYVELSLIDHVIVGEDSSYSYFKAGKLKDMQEKFVAEKSTRLLQIVEEFIV